MINSTKMNMETKIYRHALTITLLEIGICKSFLIHYKDRTITFLIKLYQTRMSTYIINKHRKRFSEIFQNKFQKPIIHISYRKMILILIMATIIKTNSDGKEISNLNNSHLIILHSIVDILTF